MTEALRTLGLHRVDLKRDVVDIETSRAQSLRPFQGVRIGTENDGLDLVAQYNGIVTVTQYQDGTPDTDFFHLPANQGFSREMKDGRHISVQGGELRPRRDFFFDYPDDMPLRRLVAELEPKREQC